MDKELCAYYRGDDICGMKCKPNRSCFKNGKCDVKGKPRVKPKQDIIKTNAMYNHIQRIY